MNKEDKEKTSHEKGDTRSESDLQHEIDAGEWMRLREFSVYRRRSRQGKIIATLQALTNRIIQLEKLFYQLVSTQPQKSTKLLAEIKRLRVLKEYLLQCLIWEEQGDFDDSSVPYELEGML
ncbi:MAG TPA: hypothetical protein PLD54_05200 [Candidatus Levybacteria bacterium]|nr:hypothetical protein [Candidatus Levybacteria bacterium]